MTFFVQYKDINDHFPYRESPLWPDMPSAYWRTTSWLNAPVEFVTFDNLYAQQNWYHPDVMEHETYGVGFVVIVSDGKYIIDGHHTAIQEKTNGASGFSAHVKRPETDSYDEA